MKFEITPIENLFVLEPAIYEDERGYFFEAYNKEQFLKNGQIVKAKFLRKGKKEQWKTTFSQKENLLFIDNLKNELIELGYDLEK